MPSLKEVKTRINSVSSTRKITSAMKMVASAKLHGAQKAIESMRPYESRLTQMMARFIGAEEGALPTPYAEKRAPKRVALVVYTSNSSLCGAFNSNIIREMNHCIAAYKQQGAEVVAIYPMGKKGCDAVRKLGYAAGDYSHLLDHPAYTPASEVAQELMDRFVSGDIDHVELIYHHFKSAGSQVLTKETFLPIEFESEGEKASTAVDYIVEPSPATLISSLVPKALHLKLYTTLLDSLASEHAARVIAMQTATDNADELLHDLTLQYNKTRQQAITAELLDIVGGSMQ